MVRPRLTVPALQGPASSHPRHFGHDKWKGRCRYIVMEYMPGGTLASYIESKAPSKRLTEPVVKHFVQQLCDALSFLHGQQICHRDLKPENLLLSNSSDDARLVVADFGFAKEIKIDPAESLVGTPLWMAPEVLLTQTLTLTLTLLGCPPRSSTASRRGGSRP